MSLNMTGFFWKSSLRKIINLNLVELQKKKSTEYSYIDINRKKVEESVYQRKEARRLDIEPYPFTTNIKYLYTFQEVAFLIYKLKKLLRNRAKSETEKNLNEKQDGKRCFRELVRKKKSRYNLEKITSMIDAQLNDVRQKSLDNKRRWKKLRIYFGFTKSVSSPRNQEVEKLRINLLRDLTIFLSKEDCLPRKIDKSFKDEISKDIPLTSTAASDEKTDQEENAIEKFKDNNSTNNKKEILHKNPLQEKTVVEMKKKDALGRFLSSFPF